MSKGRSPSLKGKGASPHSPSLGGSEGGERRLPDISTETEGQKRKTIDRTRITFALELKREKQQKEEKIYKKTNDLIKKKGEDMAGPSQSVSSERGRQVRRNVREKGEENPRA